MLHCRIKPAKDDSGKSAISGRSPNDEARNARKIQSAHLATAMAMLGPPAGLRRSGGPPPIVQGVLNPAVVSEGRCRRIFVRAAMRPAARFVVRIVIRSGCSQHQLSF
jgi:hypothetical protein